MCKPLVDVTDIHRARRCDLGHRNGTAFVTNGEQVFAVHSARRKVHSSDAVFARDGGVQLR